MMHKTMAAAVALVMAGVAAHGAQEVRFDQSAAMELLKQPVAAGALGAIQGNAQLQQGYAQITLEQELSQEASRRGLGERIDVLNALQQARRQILIQALREDLIRSLPLPTEQELRDSYKKNMTKYTLPEAYQMDVIVIDASQKDGKAVAADIVKNQKFDEAKLKAANARQVVAQGLNSWVAEQGVPPAIWADLPKMKKDEIKQFDIQGQVVLVRRGDRRESRPLTFDEARTGVQAEIMRPREEKAWNDFVQDKAKKLGFGT